jgi:uncharacterized protein
MRTAQVVSDFLDRVTAWATHQPTIAGVALVGSYARGEARPNSDLSRILVVSRLFGNMARCGT